MNLQEEAEHAVITALAQKQPLALELLEFFAKQHFEQKNLPLGNSFTKTLDGVILYLCARELIAFSSEGEASIYGLTHDGLAYFQRLRR